MLGEQTKSYLLYSRGLMPDDLTLGSLHLDPANPIDNENKFFHHTVPIEAAWLRTPQIDRPCSVSAHASREWLVEAGVPAFLKGEIGSNRSTEITVSGNGGRRLQLKDPESFLNEVILTSEAARSWLASRLTLLHRLGLLSKIRKAVSRPPRIWMVTGLQYIEGATVSSGSNKARHAAGRVEIPVPDPSLVATMADVPAVQGEVRLGGSEASASTYNHTDERVWAAQFRPLKVEYRLPIEATDQSRGSTTWIKLHGPENMRRQGIRTEEDTEEDLASAAQIVGVGDIDRECSGDADSGSLLNVMLEVDWVLLDEMLFDSDS